MELRAPCAGDAVAVHTIRAARERSDFGHEIYTLEEQLDAWGVSDFDLAADAIVADDGGELIGYADVRSVGSFSFVAPAHEGRGAGSKLLAWTERREREFGQPAHRQLVASTNASAIRLLCAAGYGQVRSYSTMSRSLDGRPQPGSTPPSVTLRAIDIERDALALHALDDLAFRDAPDYCPESPQAFREEHLEIHNHEPLLSCVAESGGEMVGFICSVARRNAPIGFVDILAVHPDHQRRGIGGAMLRHVFAAFADAGLGRVELGVASDNPRALRLYEGAGMTEAYRWDIYERPIGAGVGPSAGGD